MILEVEMTNPVTISLDVTLSCTRVKARDCLVIKAATPRT